MNRYLKVGFPIVVLWTFLAFVVEQFGADAEPESAAEISTAAEPGSNFDLAGSTIWQNGVGGGFLRWVPTAAVELGVAPGIAAFGGREAHDFALLSLTYGRVLSHVMGEGHWWRGNLEGHLELFGGGQYSPSSEWLIGLTPHLRYDFATGSRWIPFFDIGAGVTATGIGAPDLSGTFEFNLQATTGLYWFLRKNLALTGEVRYLHISCGGIHSPNLGANNVAFIVGLTRFFGR